jgi:hypothetical protein
VRHTLERKASSEQLFAHHMRVKPKFNIVSDVKRIASSLLIGTALAVVAHAETARILYTPAPGTKTRYQYVTTSSAQILDFSLTGATAQQQEQIKQQLLSSTNTRMEMDNTETVLKLEANGSRRVSGVVSMTITSGASGQAVKAGFNSVTVYKPDGSVVVEQFKIDKARTDQAIASALEANSSSFKNLFSQASGFSFYGKTLSERPTEVVAEIPAPATAANLNLKYRMRTLYTLLGRTSGGGYRIASTSQLEPVNYSGTQQGAKITLKLEATPAKGEITLFSDGRVERATVPSDMTLTTTTSAQQNAMRYTLRIKSNTEIKTVK